MVVLVVVAVVAGLVLALSGGDSSKDDTVAASDDDGDRDRESPPPSAELGALQVTEGPPPIDLEEQPEDGQLNGRSYRLTVDGFSFSDQVPLPSEDGLSDDTVVHRAADGEHWLVAQLTVYGVTSDDWNQSSAEFALAVDGRRDDLGIYTSGGGDTATWTVLASVPDDADEVGLVGSEVELEQTWSFLDGERSDDAPEVLYRDERSLSTDVNQQFSLPYAVEDAEDYDDAPFGEEQASMSIGGVALNYVVEDGDGQVHTASGPDRALLYLTDVDSSLSSDLTGGYEILPENMVLTLPDGTAVEATRLSEDWTYLLGGFVVWDVPADIETATITVTPGRGPATDSSTVTYDFQDGEATFDLDFGPS